MHLCAQRPGKVHNSVHGPLQLSAQGRVQIVAE